MKEEMGYPLSFIHLNIINIRHRPLAGVERSILFGEKVREIVILTGQPVLLDGSKSNDPDNAPNPMSYLWSFTNLPLGSLLTDVDISGKDTALPSFTPDVNGLYQLDLAVSDGAATTYDQISVTAGTTTPPVANAGLDQIVQLGQSAILDGSGSYDQDGLPQPITYQWSLVSILSGSNLTNTDINNANTVSAGVLPDIAGSYVLQLAVNDGTYTSTDNVVILVDGAGPTGSILIDNGSSSTTTTSVILSLSCIEESEGSGCAMMRFSNDNVLWSAWEAYSISKAWTLSSGNGIKTVYVQFKDFAENISTSFSDTIQLLPIVSVTLVPDATSIPRGGNLGYTVTVKNNTNTARTFKYWTYINLPNASRYPATGELFGPVTVTLSAGQSKSAHLTHGIPTVAPLGSYTYHGQVGPYPVIWDSDSFSFTVTAAAAPLLQGNTIDGWDLLENGIK